LNLPQKSKKKKKITKPEVFLKKVMFILYKKKKESKTGRVQFTFFFGAFMPNTSPIASSSLDSYTNYIIFMSKEKLKIKSKLKSMLAKSNKEKLCLEKMLITRKLLIYKVTI